MEKHNVIKELEHYSISLSRDGTTMLFGWNDTRGLSALKFADGITDFAASCVTHQPTRAVIDARQLDQGSEAFSWLRGQTQVDGLDAYDPWWLQTIVPLYHDAHIAALAVATGDPTAPGEVPTPPEVNFKIGYFADVESASTFPSPI
ncbi:MAG: hypothetical protein ACC654_01525 [Acidimicrobiia bacterium]